MGVGGRGGCGEVAHGCVCVGGGGGGWDLRGGRQRRNLAVDGAP